MKEPIILIMEIDPQLHVKLRTLAEQQGWGVLFAADAAATLRYFHPDKVSMLLASALQGRLQLV
jgi:DNA-binding response OmpR family regulator